MAAQFTYSHWYHNAYEYTNFKALRKDKVYLWPSYTCGQIYVEIKFIL